MRKLVGIFVLIVFLCLNADIGYAQNNDSHTQTPQSTATTKQEQRPPKPAESQEGQENSSKDLGAVPEDLSVEERMANIAQESNDLACIQVIIAIVGLVLLLLATLFALGAWLSARKGVTVTEIIGKKQTKAYLSIERPIFTADTKCGFPTIRFTIKNTGNSPASDIQIKNVSYTINLGITDPDNPFSEPKIRTFSDANTSKTGMFVPDIMAGETREIADRVIRNHKQIKKKLIINDAIVFCASGKVILGKVEVFCNIKYTDVFGDSFEIPYCFWADVEQSLDGLDFDIIRDISASDIKKFAKFYEGNNAQKHENILRQSKHQEPS